MGRAVMTRADLAAIGFTPGRLKGALKKRQAHRVIYGFYVLGDEPPTDGEVNIARLASVEGVAAGELAAYIYGLDAVKAANVPVVATGKSRRNDARRLVVQPEDVHLFQGLPVTSPERTLIELAGRYSDDRFEQFLESALRKKLVTTRGLLAAAGKAPYHGNRRLRRVLQRRGLDTPPTESMLETLAVQLLRTDATIPEPVRQYEVLDARGCQIARVDLAFPDAEVFLELDGKWHDEQRVYDANRQTRISAATRWRVGRFTWIDITRNRRYTLGKVRELLGLTKP